MNLYSLSLKTDCTNKFSIPKLSDNSSFKGSNSTYGDRKNYQVTFTFIENPESSLKNTIMMKHDELLFILIKK